MTLSQDIVILEAFEHATDGVEGIEGFLLLISVCTALKILDQLLHLILG
jgi:hypothetical protein